MPKPAKTKIKLDTDSFQILLQEIYNDILNVQKKANSDMEGRKSIEIKNSTDAFQIGKINNESLKIIDSSVDKKLALAKLQSQVISNDKQKDTETNKTGMTDEDKNLIRELILNKSKKDGIDYEMGDD